MQDLKPGQILTHDSKGYRYPRYLIALLIKQHWRDKPTINDISMGLDALVREIRRLDIKSISIPPLGVGMVGLKWTIVRDLIEKKFNDFGGIRIHIYEPKSYIDVLQA
jgi:hypothetical protein